MIKRAIVTIFVLIGMASVNAVPALAAECSSAAECVTTGVDSAGDSGSGASATDIITTIVNILLFILGAVAVIMIVIGGIKYTTSNGDAAQVKSAKDTILYSIIGVVVALLAYALVNWVVANIVQ